MNQFVIVQDVYPQVSADYAVAKNTRTLIVDETVTVKEVMDWAMSGNVLGRGDVIISRADYPRIQRKE